MNITIVTISYNQAAYLPACIDSVEAQLESCDKHIIVDPGSKDGSRDIITAYCNRTASAKALFEADLGPADGLNNGFRLGSGEILGYINADDFILPGALNYVRHFFKENPRVDVLIGAIKIANACGALKFRGRVADTPCLARLRSGFLQYYQQGTFFRREAFERVGGFNIGNRTSWDSELIIDMLLAGAKFSVKSKPLGAFRLHDQSITGSGGQAGVKYMQDRVRMLAKYSSNKFLFMRLERLFFKLESRMNPLRIIKQMVQV